MGIITYPMYINHVNWKIAYFSNAAVLFILTLIFYSNSIESLRVSISKENCDELVTSIRYITKINGINEGDSENLIKELLMKKIDGNSINQNEKMNSKDLSNEISSSSPQLPESFNIPETSNSEVETNLLPLNNIILDKNKESSWLVFIKLLIAFSLFMFLMITAGFEIKNYGKSITITLYIIFNIISMPFFIFISFLMNIKVIGRRYALLKFFFVLTMIKISNLLVEESNKKYLYLSYRVILYSIQIPIHTLVNESFPTKKRNSKYGNLYISAKCLALASPFVLEFFNNTDYTIILGSVILIISTMILWIKETHSVDIE